MTRFKTILMTAAMLAVPAVAFAQVSTDAVTDTVKDKAVDTVIDNMTADDAMVAAKTMIKGGSKEDAAKAVVKKRVDTKVESMTGGAASMDGVSKDGLMDKAKDMAMDKATGSAAPVIPKTKATKTEKSGLMDKAKDMAMDKVKGSSAAVIPKGEMMETKSSETAAETTLSSAPALPPISCPSGTKATPEGTCMITGDWKP